MNLSYKQVNPEEVDALHDILRLCGQDMKDRLGLSHWVPPYPFDAMRRSAQERQVYAVWLDTCVVATFTIGTQPPPYYHTLPGVWESWDASIRLAMYVNRLAVLPSLQGQGIGTWCMHMIERISLQQSCEAIRLDAYDKHSGLHIFYTRLGYNNRGSFTFFMKRYGETGMVCFEKRVHALQSSSPPAT
jgi:GNAT superfamily N-acetyltransferase